ncbi:MAG: response regulator [Gemmatimonadaceae bacterium]|nr:response regulator [Gemmatimonadaceae bacterium]
MGAFIDITARRRNERALADALARFDAFMQALPAIAFVKDAEGRMIYLNPFAEQALGWTRDAWWNRTALDLFPPEMADSVEQDDARALASDAPVVTLRRTGDEASGTLRWWNTIRFAIRESTGRPLLAGISIDVTEQQRAQEALRASEARARQAQQELEQAIEVSRRTEEKFRQSQKMEAVGRLAGGIAHDFNNLLTVILGNGELLAEKLRSDPLKVETEEILGAGRRASDLTRQLLAFSRKQALEPRVLNLNTVISGMEPLLRRLLGEDIELAFLLSQRLYLTRVDPSQIEQVLLNLVVNARDAMPTGGRLTIETSNVTLDDEYVRTHPEAIAGPHAMLSVSDTGSGMSQEVQSHLFEPFFTTKEQGKGTGLGLSTVYGIVRQSGGVLWVYSEPGQGSIFKVYIPQAGEVEDPVPPPRPDTATLRGTETILLVEDDAKVRLVLSAILKRAGYHVIEAANGGEALLICEQHGGTIPLMLTDIVMPKMNGRQLAERLRRIRPDLRVVFMSGYTENVVVHHGVVDSGIDFLQKPLTAEVLLPKIREVLDRRV